MPNTPRPLPRQPIRRTLEAVEKKHKDILTPTAAFDKHLKDIWDFSAMDQKQLLALQEHARTRRVSSDSYFIVRVASR